MMPVLHPLARREFDEAADYYELRQPGLGGEFEDEVAVTIQRILCFPNAGTPFSRNTRRCLIRRFPYAILYQISEDKILIVAVMHVSRKPDYWADRLD